MFKWLVVARVVLCLAGYGVYLYTGKVPWEFVPGVSDRLNELPLNELTGQDRVYKWRDAHGEWHYTSELPGEGVEAEVITLDKNTNVLPGTGETNR